MAGLIVNTETPLTFQQGFLIFWSNGSVNTERQYKYLQYVIHKIPIRYFSLCEGEAAQISNKRRGL